MLLLKKIATILLLTLLFFNWVGYRLFISWFESRATARLEMQLDNDQYDASQLIVFKVSASAIPYSNASAVFERADGELEVGNIHYRYVRKRLYNDSLEFLCIPDAESSRFRSAKDQLLRHATASLNLLKAFYPPPPAFTVCNFPARAEQRMAGETPSLSRGHTQMGWQPPRPAVYPVLSPHDQSPIVLI